MVGAGTHLGVFASGADASRSNTKRQQDKDETGAYYSVLLHLP